MDKMNLINDVVSDMTGFIDPEQQKRLKIVLTVRLKDFSLETDKQLPSLEVRDNEWLINRFKVDNLAKGNKISSIKCYLTSVNMFFNATNLNFTQVTGQSVTDYLALKQYTKNAKGEYPAQNYIASQCRNLFVFFQWAYKKHHIQQDIMLDVDRIKAHNKKKDRLSMEEIEACREAIMDQRESALFELMLSTGMRVGEIARLNIEDINLVTREIQIHGYKSETSDREGVISIKARNAIKRYIGDRNTGVLFIPKKKIRLVGPMTNGCIEDIAKKIGRRGKTHLTTTVHVYRKTFASELYRKVKDIKVVSIMLGHSDTRVTEQCYLVDDIQDIKMRVLAAA